ncbi:hypothetical protein [Yinghuangia sp. YIM S09857]|uniref:hypothetical protein n=1 Tax=Yinghuangia sp. YIM S09857 TaxID=3436929 RepID=UPI003F5323A8
MLAAACLVVAASGCTGSDDAAKPAAQSSAGSPPPSGPPAAPSASTSPPADLSLSADCGDATVFTFPDPAAAPYTGPGPHLAVGDTFDLPREWVAYDPAKTRWDWDVPRAQLLICQTEVRKRGEDVIRVCTDTSPSADLYAASYTYTVYELKTGRQVATLDMDSNALDYQGRPAGCPVTFTYWVGRPYPEFFQDVDEDTYTERLRPLIMGTV